MPRWSEPCGLQITSGYWTPGRLGGGVQLSTGVFKPQNGNPQAVLVSSHCRTQADVCCSATCLSVMSFCFVAKVYAV